MRYEIGNAITALIKRGQVSKDEALDVIKTTKNIPVRLVSIDIHEALVIAIEFSIYAYDAYFLQCAKTTSHPLMTLDKKMRQVANQLKIPLVGEEI